MKRTNRNEGGFTLIELMFVAFLFLLLAGFSATGFRRSYDAWSGDLAARDIVSLMNFARARAIMERVDYGVHVSPQENRFWLVRRSGETADNAFARIPGSWGKARSLPRGMDMKNEETVVVFYPNGTATPAALQLVARDRVIALTVDPVSGKGRAHGVL